MDAQRDNEIQRTTVYLPRWLHKAIKLEAVKTERSITELVVEAFSDRYPDLAPKTTDLEQARAAA